jgi:hypothetical protein
MRGLAALTGKATGQGSAALYFALWQTASTLLPSGSVTNAP